MTHTQPYMAATQKARSRSGAGRVAEPGTPGRGLGWTPHPGPRTTTITMTLLGTEARKMTPSTKATVTGFGGE